MSLDTQTLYNHGLDELIEPERNSHAADRARTAPRRTKRKLNERIAMLQQELERVRAQYERLLVMWQTVEYNLRERHQLDPRTLYARQMPKPDRSTARAGRRNPRIARLRAIDPDPR